MRKTRWLAWSFSCEGETACIEWCPQRGLGYRRSRDYSRGGFVWVEVGGGVDGDLALDGVIYLVDGDGFDEAAEEGAE